MHLANGMKSGGTLLDSLQRQGPPLAFAGCRAIAALALTLALAGVAVAEGPVSETPVAEYTGSGYVLVPSGDGTGVSLHGIRLHDVMGLDERPYAQADQDLFTIALRHGGAQITDSGGFVRFTYRVRDKAAPGDTGTTGGKARQPDGYDVTLGGATGPAFGEIRAGFRSPTDRKVPLQPTGKFTFGAALGWMPTLATKLKAFTSRTTENVAAAPGLAGVSFGAGIEHEPIARLALHADARYVNEATERDTKGKDGYGLGLGARYRISHNSSIGADYRFLRREPALSGKDEDLNLFLLRLQLRY